VASIKVFMANTIYPVEIYKGQHISFYYLPAGEQTASGHEEQVRKATLENESGRTINVTWDAVGGLFKNKIVTKHAPLLRRMMGSTDTYRFDKCIGNPQFFSAQEEAEC
jgi:hypothetical protein